MLAGLNAPAGALVVMERGIATGTQGIALQDHGIQANWTTLRQWLSSQVRATAVFQRPDGHALHVRKATRPEGQHLAICQALGLDSQPGGIEKLVH